MANDETIRVYVVSYPGRKNLMMRFLDPLTGKQSARSTGTSKKKEAERIAAKWESELQEGRYQKPNRMTWQEFVDYHDEHRLDHKEASTADTYDATIRKFERYVGVKYLAGVTTTAVTRFTSKLRAEGLAEETVARHLRHLRAILRWANKMGLLTEVPKFDMPKRCAKMKGRPISDEEFHILLSKVEEIVGETQAPSWKFLLRGYWTSGLRLNEALNLHWGGNVGHAIDYSRKRPMFRICGAMEKGKKDRLLPMAPEFVELLETVDPFDRYGHVFEPIAAKGSRVVRSRSEVGKTISGIGEAAGIVVDYDHQTGEPKKFASTQDLRRAFGFRWAKRVMPATLMKMMRHAKIETTMKYYVGDDADQTAEAIWDAVGNTLGNSQNAEG